LPQIRSFKESLTSHIRFVEMCFLDWEVFHKARSAALLEFVRSLNESAGLPHRATCIKILGVITTLVKEKLSAVISKHASRWGAPHSGCQSDIWSEKSCRESFFCARLSMMLEPSLVFSSPSDIMAHRDTLIDVSPMVCFAAFSNTKHSGQVIADIKTEALARFGLDARVDISLYTEDGASNNKSSARLMKVPFRVCFPHNLARAVLFSTGMTGTPCRNPLLKDAIEEMSKMAAAPHRSVKVTKQLQEAQLANGTSSSRVLTTSSMNATRWTGLYRMTNKNCRLKRELRIALTGSETGDTAEEPADGDEHVVSDDSDPDEDEVLDSSDDDLPQVQANIAANKEFPLAHRLMDSNGFKNNALLESVLTQANEVCLLVQKHEGMGLSLGYQMAGILYDMATAPKVDIVSGTSADGTWRPVAALSLPLMFRTQRTIFAEELSDRFHVKSTPDKLTLIALMMDPSVDTSKDSGIFNGRPAAQKLMEGSYRAALRRRGLLLSRSSSATAAGGRSASAVSLQEGGATTGSKRPAADEPSGSSGRPASKKGPVGPASVLELVRSKAARKEGAAASSGPTDHNLDMVKEEESKYASLKASALVNSEAYIEGGIFDQAKFWVAAKSILPIHYSLWVAEFGSAKVASANVETVFSGAGKLSQRSRTMSPQLLSDYAFCHFNYKYRWLRPSAAEISEAYQRLYGGAEAWARAQAVEDSGGDSSDEEAVTAVGGGEAGEGDAHHEEA
jgi:hypothetical protein